MSTEIKVNKIIPTISKELIDNKYDFFYLTTSDKYIKRGAFILDVVSLDKSVKAVKFESGKKMIVLLEKDANNTDKIKEIIAGTDEGSKYSFEKVSCFDIPDFVIVQILLNALGTYDLEFLKFSNLTGHLYCYHEAWLKHGKEKQADIIWQVPTLEISVDKDMCIHLDVRHFTSEKLKNKIIFDKKKFEDYPKYVFSAKKTLRRKLNSDNEPCFIMRQIGNDKKDIKFLSLKSHEEFSKTKMGVLQDVVNRFNNTYEGLAKIEFESKVIKERIDYKKRAAKESSLRIKELLSEQSANIVDLVNDTYSKAYCENIKDLIKSKYDIVAKISARVHKDCLNICLIHNAEYYDGVNDPHDKVYKDASVQHITFEDFSDSSEFAISTVINELLIKKDLTGGKITLFDWGSLGFSENMLFGIEAKIDDISRYFFIDIAPNGEFTIREQENTLFEMNEYSECVDIFEEASIKGETIKGIIKTNGGQVNVIKDTSLYTIPEIDEIYKYLSSGDNKLRGKEKREELMSSLLDIKLFEEDTAKYYFVGTIGDGMKDNIQRASVIRKIEGYNGSDIMFDRLLPLMSVTFVRNGQLTVVPFPYKYLREYITLNT